MCYELFKDYFEIVDWLQKGKGDGDENNNSVFIAKKRLNVQNFYSKYDLACEKLIPSITVFKIFSSSLEYNSEVLALSIGASEKLAVPILYSSGLIKLPEKNLMFIETEYLNGKIFQPTTKQQIARALFQCSKTMQSFHDLYIVHNDLKPEHLMQNKEGNYSNRFWVE